jgi:hypothetical protein
MPALAGQRCPLCGPVLLRTVKTRRRHVDASAPPAYDGPRTQWSRLRLLRLRKAPLTRTVDTRVDIAWTRHGHELVLGHDGREPHPKVAPSGMTPTKSRSATLGTRRRLPRRMTGSSPRATSS